MYITNYNWVCNSGNGFSHFLRASGLQLLILFKYMVLARQLHVYLINAVKKAPAAFFSKHQEVINPLK
jgi:hypothetical protein